MLPTLANLLLQIYCYKAVKVTNAAYAGKFIATKQLRLHIYKHLLLGYMVLRLVIMWCWLMGRLLLSVNFIFVLCLVAWFPWFSCDPCIWPCDLAMVCVRVRMRVHGHETII